MNSALAAAPRTGSATVELDLAAVTRNTRLVRARTSAAVMAVVKADGYGVGALAVARAALAGGATSLGVTGVAEALALRAQGVTAPVLSWLNPSSTDFRPAVAAGVDLAVPGLAHLLGMPRGARVHLHLDTGMTRDGAAVGEWARLCEQAAAAQRSGRLHVVGVMSHLACAEDLRENALQRSRFEEGLRVARRAGLEPDAHLAATAGTFADPSSHHDLVRIGAGLLGIDPTGTVPLRGAVTFRTPLTAVRRVRAGTPVGYGHTWYAPRDTTLGLLPLGYADGVPRDLAAEAEVSVAGRRCRVVGRVSMDQTVVDLGQLADLPAPELLLGADVTVFGPGDDGEPRLSDWARWSGRLDAELLVGLGRRVHRSTT